MNAFYILFLFFVTKWPICFDYALMSNLIFHLTQAPRSVEKSGGGLKSLGGVNRTEIGLTGDPLVIFLHFRQKVGGAKAPPAPPSPRCLLLLANVVDMIFISRCKKSRKKHYLEVCRVGFSVACAADPILQRFQFRS